MKIIDTHCHLYLPEFDHDRQEVIQRSLEAGIGKIILPNVDRETIDSLFQLSNEYPMICYPALGLHPCSVNSDYSAELKFIYKLLSEKQIVAIGEVGLDYYWDTTFSKQQINAFEEQIGWAKDLDLPLIIHVRESHAKVMETLRKNYNPSLHGVFHCFSGDVDQAKEITDMGFCLGIGGVVTFKNSNLSAVLKHVSPEYIVIETDAPYLAPMPFRGKRNESAYLKYIISVLSGVYERSEEEIIEITTNNAFKLFNLFDRFDSLKKLIIK